MAEAPGDDNLLRRSVLSQFEFDAALAPRYLGPLR